MQKLFVIETVTSERDRNSNCYHFVHVIRTSDGAKFTTEVGGESSARHHARNAGLPWGSFIDIQCVIPKRQFKELFKGVKYQEQGLEKFFRGEIEGERDHYHV